MLKRKFYDFLKFWKETKKNECLLVKGARQIGKTFIIDKFGKDNYDNYYYLNFFEHPEYKKIFDDDLMPETLYSNITLYIHDFKIEKGKTMIFLDEIQYCPKARTALKFLAIEGSVDVIASGSLLGIQFKEEVIPSIPVGYERQVKMHSLDFEEFLWAMGVKEESIAYVKTFFDKKEKVPSAINDKFMSYLRMYMVVGGMPEVVNAFIETKNYQQVHETQEKILNAYEDDITQYASVVEKPKIKKCYFSIPAQLAKENTKFQYSFIEKKATSRRFSNSIDWLVSAGLTEMCKNVSAPLFPLRGYAKVDQFKLYLSDIGLLTAMYGFELKSSIISNDFSGPIKGGIYENLVLDILSKRKIETFYYKTDNNSQEIEFLLTKNSSIIPVEVKAGNGRTISLNNFIEEFNPPYAYKMIDGNIGVVDKKITLPLYMAMFI